MAPGFRPVRRALLSVSDKTGLVFLARELHDYRVQLIATGGTARSLRRDSLPTTDVSEITGFPELMDGRLKTLHPLVHGALLGQRDNPEHLEEMRRHDIEPIDLLVVNLYPFQKTLSRTSDESALMEQIDIGGPAMIRAAAKNHFHVCVLTSPEDYPLLLAEMRENNGAIGPPLRRLLAAQAYRHTSLYDAAISGWMAGSMDGMPALSPGAGKLSRQLRYGENPHQRAAVYLDDEERPGAATAQLLQGKPLSYNNLLDADAAFELIAEFDPGMEVSVAIIKHGIPCGVASRETVAEAYLAALSSDPVSAFGGVVASNSSIDRAAAEEINKQFTELVIAPGVEDAAASVFKQKPSMRVLSTGKLPDTSAPGYDLRSIAGGVLLQERDVGSWTGESLRQVSRRAPSEGELADLRFAFRLCKHVKSNAIVIARQAASLGISGGQVSRVEAVAQAIRKAKAAVQTSERLHGGVLASDGYFPFPDGVSLAGEAGIGAIVQPGGSKRDQECIDAADASDMAMLFTGLRQFRH